VRESGGGLRAVKALGLPLASQGIAQVSMNLVDFEVTPIRAAFEAVQREAARAGVAVRESQLIGLAPAAAINEDVARAVRLRGGWNPALVLENRLATLESN
jgi:glutamate formiminotransferase